MIKLALLFLLKDDDIYHPKLWQKFIDSSDGDIVTFCHNKIPLREDSILHNKCISEIHETSWCGIGCIKAMIAMLKEAYRDPTITHFTFASESCIPIKSWSVVKKSLSEDTRSRIPYSHYDDCIQGHKDRHFSSSLDPKHWCHCHQWLVLNREAVEIIISDPSFISMFEKVDCPEEHLIPSILKLKGYNLDEKVINSLTTWVNWETTESHPVSYNNIDDCLDRLKNTGCFFARKFTKTCNVDGFNWKLGL